MSFLKWLFGCVEEEKVEPFNSKGLKRVYKWCRAGKSGKVIVCPHCGHNQRVYHFAWAASGCSSCKAMVDKYDWFLGKNDK